MLRKDIDMKNKGLTIVGLIAGIAILIVSLYMINGAESRVVPGILLLSSALLIGATAKTLANDIILAEYLENKKKMNLKLDKAREEKVRQKASNRANLIVSLLLVVFLIAIFISGINYPLLAVVIIAAIFLQSLLNAILYIHYDKHTKYENPDER